MAAPATTRFPEWPEWLDTKALQAYACASERTIRTWIKRNENPLPASQVEGKIRVNRQTFDSWMEGQAVRVERVDVDKTVNEILSSL